MKTAHIGGLISIEPNMQKAKAATIIGANAQEVVAIKATAEKTAKLTQRYSESQVESWRKVPWFALQADGRVGRYYTNSWLEIAYMHGLWRLPMNFANFAAFIDCDTGKIIGKDLEALADKYILALAGELNALNAERVIADLVAAAKAEQASGREAELRQEWRLDIAKSLGITESYVRHSPPKWDYGFDWE